MSKKCSYCGGEIEEQENHCSLISFSKGEISNQDDYHAGCWISWLEGKMNKKVEEYADKFKKEAMKQFGEQEEELD